MDDSHARFPDIKQANDFKDVLNQQHPKIQYTLDLENNEKEINFLDITIKIIVKDRMILLYTVKMLSLP